MRLNIFCFVLLMINLHVKADCGAAKNIIFESQKISEKGIEEASNFIASMQKTPKLSQGVFSNSSCMVSKETKIDQDESRRVLHEKRTLLTNIHQNKIAGQPYKISTYNKYSDNKKLELLVFVSFSLGNTALKKLYVDAQKVGGRLILRGLYKNSFRLTQQKIKELGIVVDIDPTLFERFNIKAVPTLIITEPYQNSQNYKYDQISGNISLHYALEKLAAEGEVKEVDKLLAKLEGPSNV